MRISNMDIRVGDWVRVTCTNGCCEKIRGNLYQIKEIDVNGEEVILDGLLGTRYPSFLLDEDLSKYLQKDEFLSAAQRASLRPTNPTKATRKREKK